MPTIAGIPTIPCACSTPQPKRYRVVRPTGTASITGQEWVCWDTFESPETAYTPFATQQEALTCANKLALHDATTLLEETARSWAKWTAERAQTAGPGDAVADAMASCTNALLNALAQGARPESLSTLRDLALVVNAHQIHGQRNPRCSGCDWKPGKEGAGARVAHQGAMVLLHIAHAQALHLLAPADGGS